jgi:hypothetical protein
MVLLWCVPQVHNVTYLYNFPFQTTFEESRLNESDVGDRQKWLKEGMDCNLLYWNGRVFPVLFLHNLLSKSNQLIGCCQFICSYFVSNS